MRAEADGAGGRAEPGMVAVVHSRVPAGMIGKVGFEQVLGPARLDVPGTAPSQIDRVIAESSRRVDDATKARTAYEEGQRLPPSDGARAAASFHIAEHRGREQWRSPAIRIKDL